MVVLKVSAASPPAARRPGRCGRATPRWPAASCLARTNVAQGWPRLWANFQALIGTLSQGVVGPSPAMWANPAQLSFSRGP
jgi:hypothetical protein